MRPSRALRKAAASVAVSVVALSTAAFAPAPEQPADPVNPTDEMTTPVIPDELDLQSVATAPDRAQPAEPPATECITATSGDTLNRLATAAGITLDELLLNNPKYVPNPDRLIADVDQVCFAPGNVPAPQAAVETVAYEQPAPEQAPSPEQPAPQDAPAPATSERDAQIAQVLAFAHAQIGKWYKWGGNGPDRFDCSGLIQEAYRSAGISIPRHSGDQRNAGELIEGEMLPGDILWRDGHVYLYIGGDQVISAPQTGEQIRIQSLDDSSWTEVRRII